MPKTTLRAGSTVAALAIGTLLVAGCSTGSNGASKAQAQNNQVAATTYNKFNAAVPYPYASGMPSDPLERKNLAARLQQYNSKGSTNYVYVFAGMTDKVIGYYVIRGKVSSTGSQMTSTDINVRCGYSGDHQSCTNQAIGDDGSYGPDEGGQMGVFFFTTNGTLVETDQPFLVSSAPIKVYGDAPELDAPAK
jgi:outer membrane murein-binding lipoprotein Lpp